MINITGGNENCDHWFILSSRGCSDRGSITISYCKHCNAKMVKKYIVNNKKIELSEEDIQEASKHQMSASKRIEERLLNVKLLKQALEEVELIQEGKLEKKTGREFLKESRGEN